MPPSSSCGTRSQRSSATPADAATKYDGGHFPGLASAYTGDHAFEDGGPKFERFMGIPTRADGGLGVPLDARATNLLAADVGGYEGSFSGRHNGLRDLIYDEAARAGAAV